MLSDVVKTFGICQVIFSDLKRTDKKQKIHDNAAYAPIHRDIKNEQIYFK